MSLLWILLPVFVFIVGPVQFVNTRSLGAAIGHTIGALWTGGFLAAGIITLVFVVIERTQTKCGLADKWDPRSLPPLRKPERKASNGKTVCELIFNAIAFVWLLLLPYYPVLIFGPAAGFLNAAPMWHTFYLPVLLLSLFAILRSFAILAKPQWTRLPLWTELLQTVVSLVVVNYMINAAGQAANGVWHPFVTLASGAAGSGHDAKIVAVVNVSILVSLVCAWLGLCVAVIVQAWQFMRSLTKKEAFGHPTASLHVL
jgi:hypothetical protein